MSKKKKKREDKPLKVDMSLEQLKSLREKQVDYMLDFIGVDDKESAKHSRYIGYIDNAIEKATE